eukprot:CAMPEP_0114311538 /NCGR_PEP_ID=MMETSP0059-20121206/19877_1 /TAXON_ID=36894 /ORGANISM="Pyramimonas parkeae, Strain CCMP726" /LENGTH=126 /DNA_ID=CAMNT_0001435717 /DNA_START=554 /DNA_END=931 /DNA_ORIENTATION=+
MEESEKNMVDVPTANPIIPAVIARFHWPILWNSLLSDKVVPARSDRSFSFLTGVANRSAASLIHPLVLIFDLPADCLARRLFFRLENTTRELVWSAANDLLTRKLPAIVDVAQPEARCARRATPKP